MIRMMQTNGEKDEMKASSSSTFQAVISPKPQSYEMNLEVVAKGYKFKKS